MQLKKPYILGITGGMGVGKSTVTAILARLEARVSDADRIVHSLYEKGVLEPQLKTLFPAEQGPFTRSKVSQLVLANPKVLNELERIIHPFVFKAHLDTIQQAQSQQKTLVILDIPLLYETGCDAWCDGIILVTCNPSLQRRRLMQRPDMTLEKMNLLLNRQDHEEDKRRRFPWIIDTSDGRKSILRQLRSLRERDCI